MKRKYFVNGFEETRQYFLMHIGNLTQKDVNILANGGRLEKNGNTFYILNYLGI